MAPSVTELKSFWATSARMRMDSVPTTAEEKRQPKVSAWPKRSMPQAIIHLPSGGWTTYSPVFRI